ncbi:macro domain-containing protein [Ruminococcus sp.]|uniref:macro domain-containing protein n=1 Tax=Ruminococcus sp. TaxID=41978 RepID=UPI0025E26B5E|nr:macro domain-containing protein [Ruminococcus sp.]MBQ6252165.1 hypothetical protein [Ruminococcus sp.]
MKKIFTHIFLSHLWKKSIIAAGYVFALATTILTFISIDKVLNSINHDTVQFRVLILISLLFISVLIAFLFLFREERSNHKLYSKEKTSINVKFDDMTKYITNNYNSMPYTVVIPINNHLEYIADKNKIRPNSMHGYWLDQMLRSGFSKEEIEKKVLGSIKTNSKSVCKIGDYCYIKGIVNVNYLLVATCELNNSLQPYCSEMQYFAGIQSMIDAISHKCNIQEKVYIPVIGGGYASMNKSNQELLEILSKVLHFNTHKLQLDINVIVYSRLRDEIHITNLL